MIQQELKLMGRIDGPSLVPSADVAKVRTYRDAVIACWLNRRIRNMTKSSLAAQTGMRASHLSDYFSPDRVDSHGRDIREMPAKHIQAFEAVCGNTFVSQWIAAGAKLTVLELLVAEAA